jgi:hypothetical protein
MVWTRYNRGPHRHGTVPNGTSLVHRGFRLAGLIDPIVSIRQAHGPRLVRLTVTFCGVLSMRPACEPRGSKGAQTLANLKAAAS